MNLPQVDVDLADLAEKHGMSICISLIRDNEDWVVFSNAKTKEDIAAMEVVRDWLEFNVMLLKDRVREAMASSVAEQAVPAASTENVPTSPGTSS